MHAAPVGIVNDGSGADTPTDTEKIAVQTGCGIDRSRKLPVRYESDPHLAVPAAGFLQEPAVGGGNDHPLVKIATLNDFCQAIAQNIQSVTVVFLYLQLQVLEIREFVEQRLQSGNACFPRPGCGVAPGVHVCQFGCRVVGNVAFLSGCAINGQVVNDHWHTIF